MPPQGWKKLKLKASVHINGRHLDPEIIAIINAARKHAPDLSDDTVWVTSANDSRHMENSKHYTNEAFDIRTMNVLGGMPVIQQWAANIRRELGTDYDIVVERDHLHCELDPKV